MTLDLALNDTELGIFHGGSEVQVPSTVPQLQ